MVHEWRERTCSVRKRQVERSGLGSRRASPGGLPESARGRAAGKIETSYAAISGGPRAWFDKLTMSGVVSPVWAR